MMDTYRTTKRVFQNHHAICSKSKKIYDRMNVLLTTLKCNRLMIFDDKDFLRRRYDVFEVRRFLVISVQNISIRRINV